MVSSALGGAILQSNYNGYSRPGVSAVPALQDPLNNTGSPYAFNYSYSQANLYTGSSNPPQIFPPPNSTGTQFRWLSTVTRTSNNTLIPTSGFRFNITSSGLSPGRQVVNWTLTIQQFNCKNCTSVQVVFDFFGKITPGTNATYTLLNGTAVIRTETFAATGEFPAAATGRCPEIFCIPVTQYIGHNLTLSFSFGWNATEVLGMSADVGEIEVASIGDPIPSCVTSVACHLMQQDPSNSSSIIHTTNISSVSYNNTMVPWRIEAISIYYPVGYNVTQIRLNNTLVYHALPEVPLETEHCARGTACTESLIALNITDFTQSAAIHNSNITITSTTSNSISELIALSGGLPTRFFTSGDAIGIKVVNEPSIVNASTSLQIGTVSITFPSALSIATTPIPPTATGGVYNFTLPSDCGFNGQLCARDWNYSATFTSGFDLGTKSGSFRIDSLRVSFIGNSGGSNALTVQGRLTYGNGTVASGVDATLFAIDRGTPINRPVTVEQNTISSSRLYISNVTLVNGVFIQGQPLIVLFTVVNPDMSQPYNATLTIEHEWPGPQPHGMSVTFSLFPGDLLSDLPFNATGPQTYKAAILFTGKGVQVKLSNLRTLSNYMNGTMTPGTSPVVPNRPHAGLFNITLTSVLYNSPQAPASFILTPLYAYVSSSLAPSRYLSPSNLITTDSNGDFSATISSNFLLGAKNMTVVLLARDATGIGLVNNLSTIGLTDSTILISTTDSIGAVARDQTVATTLHLKSNSTKITEVITINLILEGNGMSPDPVAKTDLTIGPGESKAVTLTFPAPSTIGSYTLTFSSPEYGGPLTSQTLRVAILQSNLQILIPAAIGVVAAIIVLGVYLIRGKPAEEAEEKTKTKPTPGSTKTRPAPPSPPSKSLTRTRGTEEQVE